MKHDKTDAGPHGGPGGVSSDSLPEAAFSAVGVGPRGGPGGFAPMETQAIEPEEETS
jgi:hypothetical protein